MKFRDIILFFFGCFVLFENDFGFGSGIMFGEDWLINCDGFYNILCWGGKVWWLYQVLVEMFWLWFFVLIIVIYIVVNFGFVLIYLIIGLEYLFGVEFIGLFVGDFFVVFFFSVQIFIMVGYGVISFMGIVVNIIVFIDVLVGLMGFVLVMGFFFVCFVQL